MPQTSGQATCHGGDTIYASSPTANKNTNDDDRPGHEHVQPGRRHAVHRRRSRLIAASRTAAMANVLAATSAAIGNRCECSTVVGLSGQVMITTAGTEPASTSSIRIVSEEIWPEARTVALDLGISAPW